MIWFLKKNGSAKQSIPVVQTTPRAVQQVARGPKGLFNENIEFNLYLLTKRLPDPNLTFADFKLGTRSQRKVTIAYLKDLANPGIVSEVTARLRAVKAPVILDSSYVERNIQDSHWSPFPQLEKALRPDVVEAALVQGRTAVFVDGSPEVLLAPATLFDLLDTPDDAYRRWFVASSFFRLARLAMFGIATFLPAFYIALTSFNSELIPNKLAFLIASAREGTPFPIYLGAFIMMGVAEAVRMVMLRMPTAVGQTIALFTGLTLVGTGLYANLIGAPVVIIVTLTILSSMAVPDFDLRSSVRMLQFLTMLMATVLGIFGLTMAFFYISIHLVVLKSFGIPYLAPLAPMEPSGWGHTLLRENTVEMAQDETYKPMPDTK